MRRRGMGGGWGARRGPRRRMMGGPMMMRPMMGPRVIVVPSGGKKKTTHVTHVHHHPPPQTVVTETTTVTTGGVVVGGEVPTGVPITQELPAPNHDVKVVGQIGIPPEASGMPPSPAPQPGVTNVQIAHVPVIGAEGAKGHPEVEVTQKSCLTCGGIFNSNEAHLHQCILDQNPGVVQDTSDLAEPYAPSLIPEEAKRERRNSVEHLGANETNDLTQSLLPDKIIRGSLLSDPMYINAWMDLNVGFREKFKKKQESFRTKKLGFIDNVRGKDWKNIKKLCPPIKYPAFIDNHAIVHTQNISAWKDMNHKYLIREVEKMPKKDCAFCKKEFTKKKDLVLLPCLDMVHYKCLKSKFRSLLFFQKKEKTCVCELDMQDMYNAVKKYLNY